MSKALVLVSGGLDSTTCLAIAIEKYGYENVIGLSIYYGQKHDKEVEAAKKVCEYYNVEHLTMDLSSIFTFSNCSLLQGSTEEIPEVSYAEQLKATDGKPVSTYVPFRNGLFLSAAASIALSKDCSIIYYGAHADDAAGNAYPDCSDVFVESMNKAIYEGSGKQLSLCVPFVGHAKRDVVAKGIKLKAPYKLTWSCYEGKERPCMACGTCIDRAKAFAENGIKDPALEE